ncbi:MAG: VWA domain-containing protein [Aeromicrobium sp.]
MEKSILLFADCLRRHGMRVSTTELVDALRCAALPGMLGNRDRFHAALRCCLVTKNSDVETFDAVFALYFSLQKVSPPTFHATGSALDDADIDGGGKPSEELQEFGLVDGTQGAAPVSSSPSAEADMQEFFDPESLSEGYNLDEDADIVDLASMTDEISFSPSGGKSNARGMKVQLDVSRTHGSEMPGALTPAGQSVDLAMTGDEENTLLTWLGAGPQSRDQDREDDLVKGLLDRLPEHLAEHLRRLAGLRRSTIAPEFATPHILDQVSEAERVKFEESLRRLARSLQGGLAQKRRVSPRGRVDPARTTRRSLRYDGIPFRPITVERVRERSRVIVLADVSLSVRSTARFTLHMVHGMQQVFGHARTFAFVDNLVEITGLFDQHPLEHALGLVFGGEVLDVDANSNYGQVFEQFLEEFGSSLDKRTSVIVLGDGRSNGNDPATEAFAEIVHRARTTVWLTPEPSYSWGLGSCDMPQYAAIADRVQVVKDLGGLERTAERLSEHV